MSASQCVFVCVCVLIPGRTSSDSELLGISVGVPGVKVEQEKKGGEKRTEQKTERERERERERDQG